MYGQHQVERPMTQALRSVYAPGDCLVLHDAGAALYVPPC